MKRISQVAFGVSSGHEGAQADTISTLHGALGYPMGEGIQSTMVRKQTGKEIALGPGGTIAHSPNPKIAGLTTEFSPCSFHGRLLRSMESKDWRLTYVDYSSGQCTSTHSHEHAYLGVTIEGSSTQTCANSIRTSGPWTAIFHPAGEEHCDQFHDRGAKEFNIEISKTGLRRLCDYFRIPDCAVQIERGKVSWLAARLYDEFHLMDDLSWMAIEGLFIELMAEVIRHNLKRSSPRTLPWISQVQELIHDRYTERLTLFDLASAVSVHPVHLAREFRRRMGCTIGQHIRQLRIEHACRMLAKGSSSLADIALASGFADQSQFTKTFTNLVGMSPSRFRHLKSRANFLQNC